MVSLRIKKALLSSALIFLFTVAYLWVASGLLGSGIFSSLLVVSIVTFVYIAFAVYISLVVVDRVMPKSPVAELNLANASGLLKSRMFWLHAVMLVFAVVNQLTGAGLTDEVANEILNLDWSNVALAASSTLVIVLRNFNIFNLFNPTSGITNTE